jgi:hypothetical protein
MNPEKFDEVLAIYEATTLPGIRQTPGNRGSLLLVDRATGKTIAVSLWESDTDLPSIESESQRYREEMSRYLTLLTIPPVREDYAVALHEQAG